MYSPSVGFLVGFRSSIFAREKITSFFLRSLALDVGYWSGWPSLVLVMNFLTWAAGLLGVI